METLKFKTDLHCNHCIATITPYLDDISEISQWNVDLKDENKTLTVKGDNLSSEKIIDALAQAGYAGELMNQ